MENQRQINWDENGNHGQEAHPPPEQLMLYVDGELAPEEAARTESHLEACWVCRTRTVKIEAAITDFIEYHQMALTPHLTAPADTWRNFDARLDRWAEEVGRPSWLSRLGARLGGGLRELFSVRVTPMRLAFCMAVVVVAVVSFRLFRGPAVSASELLQRTMQAETARLGQVAEPVVYRKLQVRRRAASGHESIAWEIWNSAKSNQAEQAGRFRQRVADNNGLRFVDENEPLAPGLMAELEQVFRVNHMDLHRPLSAAGYAEWRKRVRPAAEAVTEVTLQDGHPGLKLTIVVAGPYAEYTLIEASLVVRRADWHPVAEHLKAQSEQEVREYELSEAAYEVLPLAALAVFAEPPLAPTATPAAAMAPIPAAASPAPSIKPVVTTAELQQAEVMALYALHQARADLGEQVEVVRDPAGQVIVRGLVENAERKEQLTKALGAIPLVRAQIQTVEEAQRAVSRSPKPNWEQNSGQKSSMAPPEAPSVSATDTEQISPGERGPQQRAFRMALERYFASAGARAPAETERRITELMNQSLARSEATLARAWALRRLAENAALKETAQLAPENKARLLAMLASHRTELHAQLRALRGALEPFLIFAAGSKPSGRGAEEASDWAVAALTVFQTVAQLDRQIHRMFSPSGPAGAPDVAAREALSKFAEIETALRSLENQAGRIATDK